MFWFLRLAAGMSRPLTSEDVTPAGERQDFVTGANFFQRCSFPASLVPVERPPLVSSTSQAQSFEVESTEVAVGELYAQFHDELEGFLLSRVASKATSDDILQSAFLKAHRALSAGEVPEHPRAFLYQIVRNLLIDASRSQKRSARFKDAFSAESPLGGDLEDPVLTKEEENLIFQKVAQALPLFLAQLKEPYRRALQLTEIEGLSQAEAAAREGVTIACMKARVRRGRLLVKDALMSCCAFEQDRRGRILECHPRQAGGPRGPACGCG